MDCAPLSELSLESGNDRSPLPTGEGEGEGILAVTISQSEQYSKRSAALALTAFYWT